MGQRCRKHEGTTTFLCSFFHASVPVSVGSAIVLGYFSLPSVPWGLGTLGRSWGALGSIGEKGTKNMVRDCPSRDFFWSTFSQKTYFFAKKCAPGECFVWCSVLIGFFMIFGRLVTPRNHENANSSQKVASKSTKTRKRGWSSPGSDFGRHFRSLLPLWEHFGRFLPKKTSRMRAKKRIEKKSRN